MSVFYEAKPFHMLYGADGACIGYRAADTGWFYSFDGAHVGVFCDNHVFGEDGRYLGEVQFYNRLLQDTEKLDYRVPPFWPRHRIGSGQRPPGIEPMRVLPPVGQWRDFPSIG